MHRSDVHAHMQCIEATYMHRYNFYSFGLPEPNEGQEDVGGQHGEVAQPPEIRPESIESGIGKIFDFIL